MVWTGLGSTASLAGIDEVLAAGQSAKIGTGATDLVAVMGGEPEAMLHKMLDEFGGIGKFVKKGQRVVLKPNIGWNKTPELAANTNPMLVGALVKLCVAAGASEVIVFDHTCDEWRSCYQNSGIARAVEANGGKMIPGNDESYYRAVQLPLGVQLKSTKVHRAILDCDVWFNMPILKNHGGAKMSIAMKNYMGIVWDRAFFHRNDLQQCIADSITFDKKPALHIVDAYRIMTHNGPQGRDENDVNLLRALFASPDPVAVDTAAVKFFNQARAMPLDQVGHISLAEKHRLGTTQLDNLQIKRIKL